MIAAMAAAGVSLADGLTKCVAPDGSVTYSNRGCEGNARVEPIEMEFSPSSGGLRPGEQRMLDRIESREAAQYDRKQFAREQERRNYIGYSDRQRLKELQSERRELTRKAQTRGISYSQAGVYREQIRAIDAEISRLQAPKW